MARRASLHRTAIGRVLAGTLLSCFVTSAGAAGAAEGTLPNRTYTPDQLYQISLGGDVDFGKTAIGTILGPAVTADKVVEAVDALVHTYLDERGDGERFVDTYRRLGAKPFKERVYAAV